MKEMSTGAKENLIGLADYLEDYVTDEQFNMRQFREEDGYNIDFFSVHNCGSVGCALGWAPFVKGLEVEEDDFTGLDILSFATYSKRVFGLEYSDVVWDLMFSGEYYSIDNTVEGAVKRIRYVAENIDSIDIAMYEEMEELDDVLRDFQELVG